MTVAAVIERTEGGLRRFLLVEEETPDGLRLKNPAGHLEPGESPQQGVVREALEETARRFTPEWLVGIYLTRFGGRTHSEGGRSHREGGRSHSEDITYLRFTFGGHAGPADPARALDSGILRTLWLSVDELRACPARHRSPLVLRGIEDWLGGRRFPLDLVHCDPSVFSDGNQIG